MHFITPDVIARVLANYLRSGRTVDVTIAAPVVAVLADYPRPFPSGTDRASFVESELWNAGAII